MVSEPQAWERQEGETSKAWAAFAVYRDLGKNRTLMTTVEALGKKPGYKRVLETWSSKFDWVSRCRAFDNHIDWVSRTLREQNNRQEYTRKLDTYRQNTETTGKVTVSLGVKGIQLLQKQITKYLTSSRDLKPADIASLMRASIMAIDIGSKMQSDALGIERLLDALDGKE